MLTKQRTACLHTISARCQIQSTPMKCTCKGNNNLMKQQNVCAIFFRGWTNINKYYGTFLWVGESSFCGWTRPQCETKSTRKQDGKTKKCPIFWHFSSEKAFSSFFWGFCLHCFITSQAKGKKQKNENRRKEIIKPMIIFCQRLEKTWQKCKWMNSDKGKLEFGRLQTRVWTKENWSKQI